MKLFNVKNALLICMLFLFSSSTFAQFTADMVTTEGGVTTTGKFYFEKPFYRMDIEEAGEQAYVVVNNETKTTRVFMPSQKMYMEMKSDDMKSTFSKVSKLKNKNMKPNHSEKKRLMDMSAKNFRWLQMEVR